MALETGNYINDLVITNPTSSDPKSQGDDHFQLIKKVLKECLNGFTGAILLTATETGTASAHVLTPTTALVGYTTGLMLLYRPTNAGTGALTVNVSALGAKSVKTIAGADPTSGDILVNQPILLMYDGTNFVLLAGSEYLSKTGNQTLTGNLTLTGNQTVSGTLGVTGATTLNNTLAVTGVATFTGGSMTIPATGSGATEAVRKDYADGLAFATVLPAQTGSSGKYITTNGTTASWANLDTPTIGTIMAIVNAATNPLTVGNQTWLKTGTVATRATYPNGPGCVTAHGATSVEPVIIDGTPFISYANGLFIITGVLAGVWTSPDGLVWTYYPLPAPLTNSSITYCAYGAGVYVFQRATSAATATVYTTTDFVTYTAVALPNTGYCADIQSLTFVNSLFVYCCSASNVAYLYTSTDGTTWTQRTLPNAAAYRSCAYGAGKFVASVGSNATYMAAYSTDGLTGWTNIAFVEICRSGVIFANGIFIMRGNTTNVLTSTTGTSFTANALPGTPAAENQLAWTGTTFQCTAASGALYSSASGTGGWTQLTTSGLVSTNLYHPVSNGSGTVLATTAGSAPIYVSDDTMASCWGINRITNSTASNAMPCGDATTAIAVQATNATDITYIVKRSGINFRTKQITSGIALTGANVASAWNGSVYVTTLGAASTAGRSSPDGVTWTARTFSRAIQSSVTTLAALTTNGRFVGVCGSTTGTTCTDGATWVDTAALPSAFYYIYTNGSTLLAMGTATSNTYYTSTDGATWTTRTFPSNAMIAPTQIASDRSSTFAAYNATQSNGLVGVYFSTDAITWTLRYLPTGAGTSLYSSCASGIWTDRAVTFDAGVTWYTNSTIAGLPGTVAHNCVSMSLASTAATTLDGTTLLTGVDAAIVSNISGSSTAPAIPNFVRVA